MQQPVHSSLWLLCRAAGHHFLIALCAVTPLFSNVFIALRAVRGVKIIILVLRPPAAPIVYSIFAAYSIFAEYCHGGHGGLLPDALTAELQDSLLGLLQISGVTMYNQEARIELQKACKSIVRRLGERHCAYHRPRSGHRLRAPRSSMDRIHAVLQLCSAVRASRCPVSTTAFKSICGRCQILQRSTRGQG